MHDVMTIQKHTENHLICGTRVHERVAGLIVAIAAPSLAIVLGQVLSAGMSGTLLSVLLAFVLLLPGLYLLLSSRRFIFEPHSKTCTTRISVFGIFRWQRRIEFCGVAIRRRYDWQLLRWLYILVLANQSHADQRDFTMGYGAGRDRTEALAHTIAEFTDATAIDFAGRPLALAGTGQESAEGVVQS